MDNYGFFALVYLIGGGWFLFASGSTSPKESFGRRSTRIIFHLTRAK
jgi:hypothetical protein